MDYIKLQGQILSTNTCCLTNRLTYQTKNHCDISGGNMYTKITETETTFFITFV